MSRDSRLTPRPEDTPRTRQRKELRSRRLAYYGNNKPPSSEESLMSSQHQNELNELLPGNNQTSGMNIDVLDQMRIDPRVKTQNRKQNDGIPSYSPHNTNHDDKVNLSQTNGHQKIDTDINSRQASKQNPDSEFHRDRSASPSRKSVVSDFTLSSFAVNDDDLTIVSELGMSTHRPTSEVSAFENAPTNPLELELRTNGQSAPTMENFEEDNLRELLGEEKFARMMKNLKEVDNEDHYDGKSTVISAGTSNWLADDEDRASNSNEVLRSQENLRLRLDNETQADNELALTTHRPEESDVSSVSKEPWNYCSQDGYSSDNTMNTKNYVQIPANNVSCAFSVDQIYAVAGAYTCNSENGVPQCVSSYQSKGVEEYESRSMLEDIRSSVTSDMNSDVTSEVRSSLVGREYKTIRQKPYGPIPQRAKEQGVEVNGVTDNVQEHRHGSSKSKEPKIELHSADKDKTRDNEDQIKKSNSNVEAIPKDTNESLHRYFNSLQGLDPVPGSNAKFDPVPDPDIVQTPGRDQGQQKPVTYEDIPKVNKSYVQVIDISDIHDTHAGQEDVNMEACADNIEGSSSIGTSKLLRPISDYDVEEIQRANAEAAVASVIGKPVKLKPNGDQKEKHNNDPDKESANNKAVLAFDDAPNVVQEPEDLHAQVTSAVRGMVNAADITERMDKVGINFDFLKQSSAECNDGYQVEENVEVKRNSVNPEPSSGVPRVSATKLANQRDMVKVCPECAAVNHVLMEWCLECHESIASTDPVPSRIHKPGPQQVRGILKKGTSQVQISKDTVTSEVRDSEIFEYDEKPKPSESMPHFLRAELSLNLQSSTSTMASVSSTNSPNTEKKMKSKSKKKKKPKHEESHEGEEIEFVYNEEEVPTQPLPNALRAELSLNLRGSMDSQPSSRQNGTNQKSSRLDEVHEGPEQNENHDEAAEVAEEDLQDASVVDEGYKEFLERLINDDRFQPTSSKNGPTRRSGTRPHSAGPSRSSVQSKVRQSLEGDQHQRRWQTSSVAWSTYKPGTLTKPSTLKQSRPASAHVPRTGNGSMSHAQRVVRQFLDDSSIPGRKEAEPGSQPRRPKSAGKSRSAGTSRQPVPVVGRSVDPSHPHPPHHRRDNQLLTVKSCTGGNVLKSSPSRSVTKATAALNEMGKYLAMSPRIHGGDLSMLLCLPDELLLFIFSLLTHGDLMRCARVCTHFKRVALDSSLWKRIVLKKRLLTDDWLVEIGSKLPSSLSLLQCHGDGVTSAGIRDLFRQCAESLTELNFTGCTRGHLTGDRILMHAANRCRNISRLDASWSNIDENGLLDICSSLERLESLCVNGCQKVTDEAIHAVVIKHGLYLHTLELFGCFNLTQRAAVSITTHCKGLSTLNLGQCWKLTDTSISQLTASLGLVEHLDLRGCKQIKDASIHHIVRNCPRLETLAIANCPGVTDVGLAEIASLMPYIRSLDLCGCKTITNRGLKSIASGCQHLEYIDVSNTGITHKGVSSLASYCARRLEVVKMNFCKSMNLNSLVRLVKNCKRLKKVYVYGVSCVRTADDLRQHNSNVWVEM